MKPPEDAPLPWKPDDNKIDDTWIWAASGNVIGSFTDARHAAYAVAAANALPGLVEACRGARKALLNIIVEDGDEPDAGEYAVIKKLDAALAALPEGVRP